MENVSFNVLDFTVILSELYVNFLLYKKGGHGFLRVRAKMLFLREPLETIHNIIKFLRSIFRLPYEIINNLKLMIVPSYVAFDCLGIIKFST